MLRHFLLAEAEGFVRLDTPVAPQAVHGDELMVQQDSEYAASLAADLAEEEESARRERAHAELAEAAAAVDAKRASRRELRCARGGALPPEPASGDTDSTRIVVRLPDGRRLQRRFGQTEDFENVADWVGSQDVDGPHFELVLNFPRRVLALEECRGRTLRDMDLLDGVLFVQVVED
mgnify:FL=1